MLQGSLTRFMDPSSYPKRDLVGLLNRKNDTTVSGIVAASHRCGSGRG
jgi:hypothetical protein